MTAKTISLGVVITLFWVASAFGQVGNDYKLRYPGFNKVNPTQVGAVLDLVLLMQEAQAKMRNGAAPGSIALFQGSVPPKGMKAEEGHVNPKAVYEVIADGLRVFFKNEKINRSIPETREKMFPGDVLVAAVLAYDSLGEFLVGKGVTRVGDVKLLRYSYTKRLAGSDVVARAQRIQANWQKMYGGG